MPYYFGRLVVAIGTTAFDDVIDVPNLTYRYNSLLQHNQQLLQLIYCICIFIDKLLDKSIKVFYHYIIRLGLGLVFTITIPILASTSLACYLMCKFSSFVYQ